ncbi:hypothetical protein [Streptomyces sp. NPDC049040]|uniref:hypothetical protein n=1 Tax=Streptomyces sp. NPDC049040 TaxID=3365593 RepID=UPI003711807F
MSVNQPERVRAAAAGQTAAMDTAAVTPRPAGRTLRRTTAGVPLRIVLAAALGLVLAGCDSGGSDFPPAHRDGGDLHAGDLHAGDVDTVVLDGVSGRIHVSADGDAHTVSGTFRGADGRDQGVRTKIGSESGQRTLTVVCGDDPGLPEPCAGDLTLRLPTSTGLWLRQTSGETDLSGIGGPLDVTTASDRLTAVALRSPNAHVRVTSGSADIGFSGAPGALSVQATSASMTLRLPAHGTGYAVTSDATSANVSVQVPRDDTAAHRVSLQVLSGSLALLPA